MDGLAGHAGSSKRRNGAQAEPRRLGLVGSGSQSPHSATPTRRGLHARKFRNPTSVVPIIRDGSTETRVVEVSRRARTLTDTGVELVSIVDTGAQAPHAGPDRCTKIARRSPTYAYLQQTTRVNNPAAAVASGDLKPTSTNSISHVEDRLRVVARLSEPVDKYRLSDTEDLRTFVAARVSAGSACSPFRRLPARGARRGYRAPGSKNRAVHSTGEYAGVTSGGRSIR